MHIFNIWPSIGASSLFFFFLCVCLGSNVFLGSYLGLSSLFVCGQFPVVMIIFLTFRNELDDAEFGAESIYFHINRDKKIVCVRRGGCKIFQCIDGLWGEKGKPLNLDTATTQLVNHSLYPGRG